MKHVLLALTLLFGAPALASADVVPECPDGERFERENGGGQCVSDGGCTVSHGRSNAPVFVFSCLVLAGATLRLRKRS